MASASDVDDVRLNTNIDADDDRFTFAVISAYVDALGIAGASAKIWEQKAATAADLVDVSEAGATERLGQLQKAAADMATFWGGKATEASGVIPSAARARSKPLTRTQA